VTGANFTLDPNPSRVLFSLLLYSSGDIGGVVCVQNGFAWFDNPHDSVAVSVSRYGGRGARISERLRRQ
jgi:hypothetical protein